MQLSKREWIELGAVLAGAAFLFFYYGPGATVTVEAVGENAPPATPDAPQYLAYNLPKSGPSTINLPTVSQDAPSNYVGCGGACTNSAAVESYFGSINSLEDYFVQRVKTTEDEYQDNLMSALPTFFTQYFNNVYGGEMSRNSRAVLSQGF